MAGDQKRFKALRGHGLRLVARDLRHAFLDHELRGFFWFAILLLVIGVVFYNRVEHWDVIQSFYFCVTTLTTVGFGDLHPTKDISRLFTACYILIGVGFILGLASVLAHQFNSPLVNQFQRLREKQQRKNDHDEHSES